ncbi:2Fe-2S iron-sulfur cluster-binding protein [Pseudoalteromonas sp. Hal099]
MQRALVECHGSQCGFCTPGIIMSMLALYINNLSYPGKKAAIHALGVIYAVVRVTALFYLQLKKLIATSVKMSLTLPWRHNLSHH